MPWTPWIRTEDENSADERIQELYSKTRHPLTAEISDLTRITSQIPECSLLIDQLCSAVYQNAADLSAKEKEIAALVTSAFNGCVH